MKIRNGFVSNSSSSSFVIIGVKSNGDSEEIMENERSYTGKYLKEYFSSLDEALIAEYISFFKAENIISNEGSHVEISQYVLPYLHLYFSNKNLIAH